MFVELSDGAIRNAYTVRILNKNTQTHSFSLEVAELPAAHLEVIGATQGADGSPVIAVDPDQTFEARALVTLPAGAQLDKERDITFVLVDLATGARATARDNFFAP
jgi:polyferredoxin